MSKYHHSRDTKSGDDVLQDEFLYFGGHDGGDGLYLYSLGEIIHNGEKKLTLTGGLGKRP